jgi:hypothetical protein
MNKTIFRHEHSVSITLFVRWSVSQSVGWSVPILLCPRRARAWFEFLLFSKKNLIGQQCVGYHKTCHVMYVDVSLQTDKRTE